MGKLDKVDFQSTFSPQNFFALEEEMLLSIFKKYKYVWQVLANLDLHIRALIGSVSVIRGEIMPGATVGEGLIYIGENAIIEPGAYVQGPAYIESGATVRHGAYIRGNVIMFNGSILGHSSEAKNSLLFPNASAPHFNYIGDSILGQSTNLGAGTKLSNLSTMSKKDPFSGMRPTIKLELFNTILDTKLSKLGAILGDGVQTGCNTVTNPGCLIGPNTVVYPNVNLRKGYYDRDQIIKLRQNLEITKKI